MTFLPCLGAGAILGIIFFGGLRWTVGRLCGARRPFLLATTSFLARLSLAGVGFFLLLRGSLACLAAGLLGFILVRMVLIRRLGGIRGPGNGHGYGRNGAYGA